MCYNTVGRSKMEYTVLMGDIVKSRSYYDHVAEAQELLRLSLNFLNKTYKPFIRAEARLQRGDEFQVLLTRPYVGFLFYRLLELLIYPLKIRCSMYSGDVYDKNFYSTERMFGTAYYEAGNLLEICKEQARTFLFGSNDPYRDETYDFTINAMAEWREASPVRGNSVMSNHVQVVAELLYPLTLQRRDLVGVPNLRILEQIFKYKEICYSLTESLHASRLKYASYYRNQSENPLPPDYGKINWGSLAGYCKDHHETCGVMEAFQTDKLFLQSCWKRGYNVTIADVLRVPRQTVDRAMTYLNYSEKRNFDGVIVNLLWRMGGNRD